jgi:hypothetical protein
MSSYPYQNATSPMQVPFVDAMTPLLNNPACKLPQSVRLEIGRRKLQLERLRDPSAVTRLIAVPRRAAV